LADEKLNFIPFITKREMDAENLNRLISFKTQFVKKLITVSWLLKCRFELHRL